MRHTDGTPVSATEQAEIKALQRLAQRHGPAAQAAIARARKEGGERAARQMRAALQPKAVEAERRFTALSKASDKSWREVARAEAAHEEARKRTSGSTGSRMMRQFGQEDVRKQARAAIQALREGRQREQALAQHSLRNRGPLARQREANQASERQIRSARREHTDLQGQINFATKNVNHDQEAERQAAARLDQAKEQHHRAVDAFLAEGRAQMAAGLHTRGAESARASRAMDAARGKPHGSPEYNASIHAQAVATKAYETERRARTALTQDRRASQRQVAATPPKQSSLEDEINTLRAAVKAAKSSRSKGGATLAMPRASAPKQGGKAKLASEGRGGKAKLASEGKAIQNRATGEKPTTDKAFQQFNSKTVSRVANDNTERNLTASRGNPINKGRQKAVETTKPASSTTRRTRAEYNAERTRKAAENYANRQIAKAQTRVANAKPATGEARTRALQELADARSRLAAARVRDRAAIAADRAGKPGSNVEYELSGRNVDARKADVADALAKLRGYSMFDRYTVMRARAGK